MKNKLTEAQEATALMQWAQYHPICKDHLIAIPNGGSRNIIEARNLKRQGVKAGVSDYFLAYPVCGYAGLWIELKRSKPARSVLSEEQEKWLQLMQNCGYATAVAYGWENATKYVNNYLLVRFRRISHDEMQAYREIMTC